jgi:hypothetical protein
VVGFAADANELLQWGGSDGAFAVIVALANMRESSALAEQRIA